MSPQTRFSAPWERPAGSRSPPHTARTRLTQPPKPQRTTWPAPGTRRSALPVLVTNCSNNYGPRQFPEKLIPLTIANALEGKPIRIYGDGLQVRDWLFVEDHVRGPRPRAGGWPARAPPTTSAATASAPTGELVHTAARAARERHAEMDVEVASCASSSPMCRTGQGTTAAMPSTPASHRARARLGGRNLLRGRHGCHRGVVLRPPRVAQERDGRATTASRLGTTR